MKRRMLFLAAICALGLWAAPARAQRNEHTLPDAQFSSDGSLVAFHAQGMPKKEFVVLEVASGRAFRFVLPAPHIEMRDLAWARSANTLMFVSLDPTLSKSLTGDPHILGGQGTHIWSIAFAAGEPQPAKPIAKGEGVRLPALSPDGSKVAYFHPVPLPREEPPNRILLPNAYAVFERDIATGEVARVAKSQYGFPGQLYYDGKDAWLFSADEPRYLNERGDMKFWGPRPGPPGKGAFDQLTAGIKSFRMERGEVLPDYPDHKQPYPAGAPIRSRLVDVTGDGRPILVGAPGPENTEANQFLNSASTRVLSVGRVEMKEAYMAFGPDGKREDYFPPAAPAPFDSNSGGRDVDGGLKRFVTIMMKSDRSKPDYGRSSARMFLFEGQALVLEREISDIIAKAVTVQIDGG